MCACVYVHVHALWGVPATCSYPHTLLGTPPAPPGPRWGSSLGQTLPGLFPSTHFGKCKKSYPNTSKHHSALGCGYFNTKKSTTHQVSRCGVGICAPPPFPPPPPAALIASGSRPVPCPTKSHFQAFLLLI